MFIFSFLLLWIMFVQGFYCYLGQTISGLGFEKRLSTYLRQRCVGFSEASRPVLHSVMIRDLTFIEIMNKQTNRQTTPDVGRWWDCGSLWSRSNKNMEVFDMRDSYVPAWLRLAAAISQSCVCLGDALGNFVSGLILSCRCASTVP